MSINGRICNYYQPGYLNGQASWFSSGPPPPWHVKCLKEMVILLGVLYRSGPIKRFLSETLISLTWSCHAFEDSWPCSFPLLLISGSFSLSGLWIKSLIHKCESNLKSPAGQTVRKNTWGNVHRLLTTLWGGISGSVRHCAYLSTCHCCHTCITSLV